MPEQHILYRARAFRRDYLAWTTLHHFLSAGLVRELAEATIAEVCPSITLGDLFDESLSADPAVTASWALAPRPFDDPLHDFLQQHVRALAWSNDAEISPRRASLEDKDQGPPHWIAAAVSLGRFDFGSTPSRIDHLGLPQGATVLRFASALNLAIAANLQGLQGQWAPVHAELEALGNPLRALALKHLGDLCADADDWNQAEKFYTSAQDAVSSFDAPWAELAEQLSDTLKLSLASADWVRGGPQLAALRLKRLSSAVGQDSRRLATLNGSHDTLVAALKSRDFDDLADVRSTVMYPPLLVQSFDTGSALDSWLRGKYAQAHRHFWSVLRRQTALGSIAEAKVTKAAYARALIDEASDRPDGKYDPEAFELGTRLLLESGQTEAAARVVFSPESVERYVDAPLIESLAARVDRHDGARIERTLVFFELATKWTTGLAIDELDVARQLSLEIVARTRRQEATFDSSQNVGGRGLKALLQIARARPEFRAGVMDEVLDLVIDHLLQVGWWTAKSDALKLAAEYSDVWADSQLRQILDTILQLFAAPDTDARVSLVSREALAFLLTPEAISAAKGDPALGKRFFSEVLHFSLGQDSESINTLFNLAAFEKDLDLSPEDASKIGNVIAEVVKQAKMTNVSNAADAIRALFAASAQVGLDGVTSAADSLVAILLSGPRSLPPFPYAYGPVVDLARNGRRILGRTGSTLAEFQPMLARVGDALAEAWASIAQNPSRLASFSLPPSDTPNPTLIRNWSIATVEFAKLLDDPSRLNAALDHAQASPVLGATVRVSRIFGTDLPDEASLSGISNETAATFYQGIGHRLNAAQQAPDDLRRRIVTAILKGVLEKGPKEVDLAVFVVATADVDQLDMDPDLLDAYLLRLSTNTAMQRVIGPSASRLRELLRGIDDESAV